MVQDYTTYKDYRRRAYEAATTLDQTFLDNCLHGGVIELAPHVEISKGGSTLRASDRPKFVGTNWYEGRARFPVIKRTLGELLVPTVQFSSAEITLNNTDGFYNSYFSGSTNYTTWINGTMTISLKIRDLSASTASKTLFRGIIPASQGTERQMASVTFRARDELEKLNAPHTLPRINTTDFPSAPVDTQGIVIPFVLGDWTAGYNFIDSGSASNENGVECRTKTPNQLYGGIPGYNVGGSYFVFAIGTYAPDTIQDVVIKRGENYFKVTFNPTAVVVAGFYAVQVANYYLTGGGSAAYAYQDGDVALISVKIAYTAGQYTNPIRQVKALFAGIGVQLGYTPSYHSSWTTAESKTVVANTKCRVWVGEHEKEKSFIDIVRSILLQIRYEMYLNTDQELALNSLHFDDWTSAASAFRIDQFNIDERSIRIESDERNFFNVAAAVWAYWPITGKTVRQTNKISNFNSITIAEKTVAVSVPFPNLYETAYIETHLKDYLRLMSAGLEFVTVRTDFSTLLRELGSFVQFNYARGGLNFSSVPMMIREIQIDPNSLAVELKLLSLHNFSYVGYTSPSATFNLSSYTQSVS